MSTVAVIIPTYNMGDTLERAVLSAAGADEIHVIDDASTDDTQAVIARLPVKITYWRWPRKSRCHVAAQRTVYHASQADHFIGMGADDVLLPGFVDAVRQHIDAAVIFSDYEVRSVDGTFQHTVSQEVSETTTLTPEQMRARLQSDRNATESGIGSSFRRDVSNWLWQLNWDVMGPHSDCIGYAAAAAMFGCVLLPQAGAAYYHGERSYSRNNVYLPEHFIKQGTICARWMIEAGLDEATTKALARKRCCVTWS
jgi:glycosyltransferase involved in cell wall biosynthesis